MINHLKSQKLIAIDTETRDPELTSYGPGTFRGTLQMHGYSYAYEDTNGNMVSEYVALRENGIEVPNYEAIKADLKDFVTGYKGHLIMFNAMYDLEVLMGELDLSAKQMPKHLDAMVLAVLLDENHMSYSLNNVAKRELGKQKDEKELVEEAIKLGYNPKADMWKMPASKIARYAEVDAELTLELFLKQKPQIIKGELTVVANLEHDLQKALLDSRFKGVRFDTEQARKNHAYAKSKVTDANKIILNSLGWSPNENSGADMEKVIEELGLQKFYTDKGAVSTSEGILKEYKHEAMDAIIEKRGFTKVLQKLEELLIHEQNGRIHPNYRTIRDDNGGTVTGRMSSANPNLQNIPARKKELTQLVRPLFIPEDGEVWTQMDYSQQEPMIAIHLAVLTGDEDAIKMAKLIAEGSGVDFHTIVSEITELPRKDSKEISLGIMYSMGLFTLAEKLHQTLEQAKETVRQYNKKLPFIKRLADRAPREAGLKGCVKTILGRTRHFTKWEPYGSNRVGYKHKEDAIAATKDPENKNWYGRSLKRAETHKALNSQIQGSGADMIKKAIVEAWKKGYTLVLSVHDENNFSTKTKEQRDELLDLHVNIIPELTVPIKMDVEIGPNWNDVKEE